MDSFTSYKEAVQIAKETDKKLSAYDFHCDQLVMIIHEEGSILTFRSAFTKLWKDWVLVFTEHHGTHVYHKSDLSSWGTYIKKEHEKLADTGHADKCEFCEKEFKVEDLNYGHHPDWDKYEETKYWIYCDKCRDRLTEEA